MTLASGTRGWHHDRHPVLPPGPSGTTGGDAVTTPEPFPSYTTAAIDALTEP